MRFAGASERVSERNEIFRCCRLTGAVLSSLSINERAGMRTGGSVVVLTVTVVVVVVVVVVLVVPPGKLAAFAGSVPWSSSVRSKKPSRSRSTPIRVPEPGGTQV